jgi:hypothetical protein
LEKVKVGRIGMKAAAVSSDVEARLRVTSCHLHISTVPFSRSFNNTTPSTHNILQMSPDTPKMSQSTRDILLKVRKMIPPMLEKFHKGIETPPPLFSKLQADIPQGKWAE